MSDFKKITIEDKEWIDPIVQSSGVRCADYCFTNMYVWQDVYSLCAKRINDRLAVRLCGYLPDGSSLYSFPVGTGELYPVIEELRENAASRGQTLKMRGIPKAATEELKTLYPKLEFKYDRDSSDYIYSAEKLSTLAGKKLHAKRNHINRFIENNDWSFEPITPENLGEVIAMNCEWMAQYYEEKPRSYYEESQALSRVFADCFL